MRKTDRWISSTEFRKLYGGSKDAINVTNRYKPKFWLKKKRHVFYVNISYLLRVNEFRERMYQEGQELFYDLIDDYPNEYQFALALSKESSDYSQDTYYNFLKQRLFRPYSEKFLLLNTNISKQLIEFVRIARRLKRRK